MTAHTADVPAAGSPTPGGGPRRTVRDAAFDVMRRFGMTTIFGNPGSTEIPFLTGAAAGHPFRARAARGLGGGDRHRLRAGPRRAGAGQPAHRRRPRQRHQRDRQRARLPGAAGRGGRPAGSPPARLRAVSGRAGAGAAGRRVPGVGQPAGARPGRARARSPAPTTRPRPSAARRWSWCRWATGWRPPIELAAGWPERTVRPASVAPGGRRRAGRPDRRAPTRRRSWSGHGTDSCEGWEAMIALAERLRCPGVAGVVRPPRRVPPGPPAVRRPPAVAPPADARDARAPRPGRGRGDQRLPAVPVRRARPDGRRRHPRRGAHRRPRRGPPQPLRAGGRRAGRRRLRGAGRAGRRPAAAEAPAPLVRPPAPAPPAAGEPLLPGHVFAALAERLPRDAVLVEETPSSQPELYRRVPRPLAGRVRGLRQRRPRLRRWPGRSGCGWAIPTARSSA